MKKNRKKPELLAPAGNLEKLKMAILYGADAVFVGGKEFSLRSQASNFSLEDIEEGVRFASVHGADVHVTCNIILHQDNLKGLKDYLIKLDEIGVKAVIVADPYIIELVKSLNLNMEVHVSTQASVLNLKAIEFYKTMGADRIVLGREVTYEDLKLITQNTPLEIEYFIHGAMCISYSGRCMLSNYFSRRDANRGGCSQSCRWNYDVYQDDVKLSQDMPFSMSSKDMALVHHIGALIDLGVDSFKIEGRMKSLHYIATVVSTYRKLIDAYFEEEEITTDDYMKELEKAANRALGEGFFYDHPDASMQLFNHRDEHPTQDFVLRVVDYDEEKRMACIESRNYFKIGDEIEIFSPHHPNVYFLVEKLYNEEGESVEVANHPMELLYIPLKQKVDPNDLGRKVTHG